MNLHQYFLTDWLFEILLTKTVIESTSGYVGVTCFDGSN